MVLITSIWSKPGLESRVRSTFQFLHESQNCIVSNRPFNKNNIFIKLPLVILLLEILSALRSIIYYPAPSFPVYIVAQLLRMFYHHTPGSGYTAPAAAGGANIMILIWRPPRVSYRVPSGTKNCNWQQVDGIVTSPCHCRFEWLQVCPVRPHTEYIQTIQGRRWRGLVVAICLIRCF